ncbi:TetR/AcrR family transcriptional regulator [Streptomyces naphthomycinicus]|uniref:TetR/AcrR family transcriptional regulator n=1 Tax=Streptomyces naphthomycinicus TaxID=2872625 RepID=UPI001CEC9B70|nr:TetR/AcrR family transcriptional regulator [Streptomyces sp. TML10]
MTIEPGLRESKKRETRQLISDRATSLFIEQGFERTTIAEIAAAARVAKKTVTNYFPRKEDLALDHHEAFTRGLARTVADREAGETPLAALARACRLALLEHSPVIGFTGTAFARMVADSPTLTARLRELHDQRENELVAALATAAPGSAGTIAPRAAAALIAGADRLLFRRIQELTLAGRTDDEITAALVPEADHIAALLAAALADCPAATARRTPPGA